MKTTTRTGFTLIEMLVVITIIALLAVLVTPMVSRAMGRAKTTQVASNLRQIGQGMSMFLQDHDGIYPVRFGDSVAYGRHVNGSPQHWQEQMDTYAGNNEAGAGFSTFDHARNPIWFSPHATRISGSQHFGLNANMWQPEWQYRFLRIPDPSGTVIVGEINANSSAFNPAASPVFDGNTITNYRVSNPGRVGLYLFADGHVQSHRGDQGYSVNPTWYRWW